MVPLMAKQSQSQVPVIPVNMVPDDILLEIFDFYAKEDQFTKRGIEAWQLLTHVCQRWRTLVFGSPRYLNLRLVCTPGTPRGMLDIWPALPFVLRGHVSRPDMDNVIAVLERSNRICEIILYYNSSSHVEKVWAVMQEPFPELAHLKLHGINTGQVVPDSFLGGSAPRLRFLELDGIPFPGLPKLLLSATHLVTLHLSNIPCSGCFSPEIIVAGLSQAFRLNTFTLGFPSLQSLPNPESQHLPPPTRTVLPALTYFDFIQGPSEYLEDLVARIEVPLLNHFRITFDQMDFDAPQLVQFIRRTPIFKAHDDAHVVIDEGAVKVILLSQTSPEILITEFSLGESDLRLSSLARVCTSILPSLSTVESLYIYENQYLQLDWEDEIRVDNTQWFDLLRPYTSVKNLRLSEVFGPRIVSALKEPAGGGTTVALPSLRNIFLEGLDPWEPIHEDIEQFIATRELSGYSCTFSPWDDGGMF